MIIVYRIAKKKHRSYDLSGIGAYNEGGRWNNSGIYALYTNENRSLALHEVLVHVNSMELPDNLCIMTIAIDDTAPVQEVKDTALPPYWKLPENIALKALGDKLLLTNEYLGLKMRSAIMPYEYNFVLNPQFPDYHNLVKVTNIEDLIVDKRLL